MHRFFINPDQIKDSIGEISGEDAHHIKSVLRLEAGEYITLCDCQGMDYQALIQDADNDIIKVKLVNCCPSGTEPKTKVTLMQGLPKSAKMEIIIQKCVELGIYEIVPVTTIRTVVRIADANSAYKKAGRWQRVAEEAAKQSKRGVIPQVYEPVSFEKAVNDCNAELKLLFWEEEKEQSLAKVLLKQNPSPESIAILIGPEGGLDNSEVELAGRHGWISVTIGSRILRTETAGMAVLSAIMYHLGEWE